SRPREDGIGTRGRGRGRPVARRPGLREGLGGRVSRASQPARGGAPMAEDPSWRSRGGGAGHLGRTGFWREALAWSGSATPRIPRRVAVFGLISAVVCTTSGPDLAMPVGPHEVAGAVLGLFLVLRTNAGYDRWWEARRLWGGIVNQTRNLAL